MVSELEPICLDDTDSDCEVTHVPPKKRRTIVIDPSESLHPLVVMYFLGAPVAILKLLFLVLPSIKALMTCVKIHSIYT